MNTYIVLFLVGCTWFFYFILPSPLHAQQRYFTHKDTLRGSLNTYRSCYDVQFYDLSIKINFQKKLFKGKCNVVAKAKNNCSKIQIDLFKNWTVDSILVNNQKATYTRSDDFLFIDFNYVPDSNSAFTATIFYQGLPIEAKKPPWDGGIIWTKDSLGRPWVAMACEGIGASLWWPNKDHLSDEPDSVRLKFEVPKNLKCISNGQLAELTEVNETYHAFIWKISYPINNYNVTFNIGHYENFIDTLVLPEAKDTLQLHFYVLDYHVKKAKKHFVQTKRIVYEYSKLFGDYPFHKDGYKLIESPYLGMEHQTAIAYGNNFINDVFDYDFIILHETAHEWWGNSVSCTDHGELWIHEAFATYAEALFIEKVYGYPLSITYLQMQKKYIKNNEEILGPSGVNYHGWKDSDMYYKGTWMLHTLRNIVSNDSLWFSIIYALASEKKLSNITSKEIIAFINQKTNLDYNWFFNQYLSKPSPPRLEYYVKKGKGKNHLFYKWAETDDDFKMPVDIAINNELITIHPTVNWQKKILKLKNIQTIHLSHDKYYFTHKNLN